MRSSAHPVRAQILRQAIAKAWDYATEPEARFQQLTKASDGVREVVDRLQEQPPVARAP